MPVMKIALINKSDTTGGAAVVTYRLMQALRDAGADARMLVLEKQQDDQWVKSYASPLVTSTISFRNAGTYSRATVSPGKTCSK